MFDKSNMPIVLNDPAFLNELGLTGQQAKLGLLGTGLFVAYAVFAPLWGFLVDAIGARKTAALSLVVWALTCSGPASLQATTRCSGRASFSAPARRRSIPSPSPWWRDGFRSRSAAAPRRSGGSER